jgi:hypothetical protein
VTLVVYAVALGDQLVQLRQGVDTRNRDQMAAAEASHLTLHEPFS